MAAQVINILQKFSLFQEQWSPKVIAELNDYQVKIARVQGDFVWHKHEDTDELFLVIEGELIIDFRDHSVRLQAGELYVVARGVEHKPRAEAECKIMLIEPRGVRNTGDAGGDLTAENDVWV